MKHLGSGFVELQATLRQRRIERGITLSELARRLNTSKSTLSAWEKGLAEPRSRGLVRWASALGVEVRVEIAA